MQKDSRQGYRKIAYVLGAGFSYGTNHSVKVGKHPIKMPAQNELLKELCGFPIAITSYCPLFSNIKDCLILSPSY